ncbi:hypothetical protein MTO96_031814 [Rhipicephalus appendiculatus]
MKLKPGAVGVVVPTRRVPMALQDKVKAELQRMEGQGVITNVTEPNKCSSHMVTVVKKDKVRICLDFTALNKVLMREYYPMPTLDDVASQLSGARPTDNNEGPREDHFPQELRRSTRTRHQP